MTRCRVPLTFHSATNTHGSDSHCLKPQSRSQGKRDRCQRRPACAIPYTLWFFDATDAKPAIGAVRRVARRSVTVNNFSGLQFALKVGCDEVPSALYHTLSSGQSGDDA
eukprot:2247128-Pleurochrysis_carterae.AAC.5